VVTGRGPGFVLPAILLLLGFVVSVTFVQERIREEQLPTRARELEALIRERQETIQGLAAEVTELSRRLADARAVQARRSARGAQVIDQLERLRAPAGLAAVHGPGVVVELRDNPSAPATREEATDLRIQDVDLQLVVNSLWASGADAVAVNGRRIVSTTAIRTAGEAILVNFRAVSSPYRVVAAGDPEQLRRGVAGSDIARHFEVWRQVYGLGFSLRSADAVTVPGLEVVGDLTWATPSGIGA
jgi:uncharacterized protein YlxW (UPF0749 family)